MNNENIKSSVVHVRSSMKRRKSEGKTFLVIDLLPDLFIFGLFGDEVNRVAFDVDGFGAGRAGILAGAATYADLVVDFRDGQLILVRNHVDGLGGAVLRTGAAGGVLRVNDTVFLNKVRLA